MGKTNIQKSNLFKNGNDESLLKLESKLQNQLDKQTNIWNQQYREIEEAL